MNWKTKQHHNSRWWQHQSVHLSSCWRYWWTKASWCLIMWIFDEVFDIATSLSYFVLYIGGNSGRTMHSSSPGLETIHKGCCSAVNDIGILHTRMGRRKLEWRYTYYCTGSLSRILRHKNKISSFSRLFSPSTSQKRCCYLAATY